jgi:putative transposase
MKASKFSEAQIACVLKQAQDGAQIAEVCRKAGISEATFYNWRQKYAALMPSEMKRLRPMQRLRSMSLTCHGWHVLYLCEYMDILSAELLSGEFKLEIEIIRRSKFSFY